MWRDMEEEAIYMGLTLDYYWRLTPKQYAKHCKMYLKKEEQDVKIMDRLNHILGQYVGIAFHNGKQYPKKPFLDGTTEVKETKPQTVDDMERIARNNTLIMGGVINNDNRRVTSTDNG